MNLGLTDSGAALQGTGELPDEPLGRVLVDLSPLLGLAFGGGGAGRHAVDPPTWLSLSGMQVELHFLRVPHVYYL